MQAERFDISDRTWCLIEPLLPGKASDSSVTAEDNRLFLEAVLCACGLVRRGATCPLALAIGTVSSDGFATGPSTGCFTVFSRPCQVIQTWSMCLCRWDDYQRASTGKRRTMGTLNQAIGRSKGGLTTKVVALADALGNLVRFPLLPGQRNQFVSAAALIEALTFDAFLGDKAFVRRSPARCIACARRTSRHSRQAKPQ